MQTTQAPSGYLLLEDGTRFPGTLPVSDITGTGEVVFTTNMTGYHEVLTDPSYAGQIVVMTAPMMGVYGIQPGDAQSRRPWVAGFIVRRVTRARAGGRRGRSLRSYLRDEEIPTLAEVDTRALTRHIRDAGAMRGVIAPGGLAQDSARELLESEPPMKGRDLASVVSAPEAWETRPPEGERGHVVCLDYGVKRRSVELIRSAGFRVTILPASSGVSEIREREPDGIFVSNGPGDPAAVPEAADRIRRLSDGGLPVFGICLGHQLVARAFGGETYKLRYGHRGGNHPVRNLETGRVEITSQNHGFAVTEGSDDREVAGAPGLRVTHRNLNDGTIEGLAHRDRPVFAVQYHPESAPGPHDSRYLFRRFADAVTGPSRASSGSR